MHRPRSYALPVGAISVAELDRGAVGREDGLLSPDVSVDDNVSNWRDQLTITEVLVFLCAMSFIKRMSRFLTKLNNIK